MRWSPFALVLLAGTAGLAHAQPTPAPPPDNGAGEPPPAEPPPPTTTTPPPTPVPPPAAATQPDDHRPSELSIGIGAGWTFSTNLETPNTVSVRLRLPSGLSFEPILRIRNVSHTSTPLPPGTEVTDTTTEFGLAANIVIPIWKHGRADFAVIGQLAFDTEKVVPDTSMADANKVTTTFAVGYGLEAAFWITRHWMISLDATNPIFSLSQATTNVDASTSMKDSTTSIGLIHDPTVSLLVHLFN